MRLFYILFFILFTVLSGISQPINDGCANATNLCANQSQQSTNTSATVDACPGCSDGSSLIGNFCFALNNTVWYSFTTNENGGDMTAVFSNIICNGDTIPATSNQLQAVIIDASIPCDESTYSAISNCEEGSSNNFTLLSSNLSPNTTYYILVDGGETGIGVSNPAQCGFSILLSGEAVDPNIDAGENLYIFPSESIELNGLTSGSVSWLPDGSLSNASILNPIATPSSTTTYILTSLINNCIYSDDVTVIVQLELYIPNTITPNGDGYNDTWIISNISNYPGAKVTVYDRWGQRVFNVTGYTSSKRWDGTNHGLRLPSATYYYLIELRAGGNTQLYNGAITIIR